MHALAPRDWVSKPDPLYWKSRPHKMHFLWAGSGGFPTRSDHHGSLVRVPCPSGALSLLHKDPKVRFRTDFAPDFAPAVADKSEYGPGRATVPGLARGARIVRRSKSRLPVCRSSANEGQTTKTANFSSGTCSYNKDSAIMISLAAMMAFFKEENKSVKRGENHFKSGPVVECSVSEGQLVGFVRASMRDKTYKVVELQEAYQAESAATGRPILMLSAAVAAGKVNIAAYEIAEMAKYMSPCLRQFIVTNVFKATSSVYIYAPVCVHVRSDHTDMAVYNLISYCKISEIHCLNKKKKVKCLLMDIPLDLSPERTDSGPIMRSYLQTILMHLHHSTIFNFCSASPGHGLFCDNIRLTLMDPIDFHSIFFSYYGSQWGPLTSNCRCSVDSLYHHRLFVVDGSSSINEAIELFSRERRNVPPIRLIGRHYINVSQQHVRLQIRLSPSYVSNRLRSLTRGSLVLRKLAYATGTPCQRPLTGQRRLLSTSLPDAGRAEREMTCALKGCPKVRRDKLSGRLVEGALDCVIVFTTPFGKSTSHGSPDGLGRGLGSVKGEPPEDKAWSRPRQRALMRWRSLVSRRRTHSRSASKKDTCRRIAKQARKAEGGEDSRLPQTLSSACRRWFRRWRLLSECSDAYSFTEETKIRGTRSLMQRWFPVMCRHPDLNITLGDRIQVEYIPPNITYFSLHRLDRYTRYKFSLAAQTEVGAGEAFTEESPKFTTEEYTREQVDIVTQGWFIGLMCAVALFVLIMLIVFFIKRSRGGKYPVRDMKDFALEPMDDRENGTFDYRITRVSTMPYSRREEESRQGRSQGVIEHIDRRTNSDDSLMEYGEGEEIEFNEDGSFIGEYTGVSKRNIDRSPYHDSSEPTSPVAIYSFA
ncbi:unnamed protein product [Leuciscus chuanchicus]